MQEWMFALGVTFLFLQQFSSKNISLSSSTSVFPLMLHWCDLSACTNTSCLVFVFLIFLFVSVSSSPLGLYNSDAAGSYRCIAYKNVTFMGVWSKPVFSLGVIQSRLGSSWVRLCAKPSNINPNNQFVLLILLCDWPLSLFIGYSKIAVSFLIQRRKTF